MNITKENIYQDTIKYLFSLTAKGIKLRLKRIEKMLDLIGHPEHQFKSIVIAGTNGKGSTSSILASLLESAGYKVGLLTSPHLLEYRERIRINGKVIPKENLIKLVNKLKPYSERTGCTFFEITTAIAYQYFADEKVDWAVLEVGMGGRLDATNTATPEISIITNIDFDHIKSLGKTIKKIAKEKAGIIKPNGCLITNTQKEDALNIFRKICLRKKARLFCVKDQLTIENIKVHSNGTYFDIEGIYQYRNLYLNLRGEYQTTNVLTALTGFSKLKLDKVNINNREEIIRRGLKNIKWYGRLQFIQEKNPTIIVDVSHNVAGMKTFRETIRDIIGDRKLIAVFGILRDKDRFMMSKLLSEVADYIIVTTPKCKRATPIEDIMNAVAEHTKNYTVLFNVNDALNFAIQKANNDDVICVIGSLYNVGKALKGLGYTIME